MINSPKLVLAIESAIAGGSLSLSQGNKEIAHWIGSSDVLRAENLLVNIDEMLITNSVDKRELDLIAVSAGPGSFTGIRIGIATALGLKAGLGIRMIVVSLLEAMIFGTPSSSNVTCALPVGRGAVCFQDFCIGDVSAIATSKPTNIKEDEFADRVNSEPDRHFMLYPTLCENGAEPNDATDVGYNLAKLIGAKGLENSLADKPDVSPIFVSKTF
jgi:tRNA threonylcarbamoyladenosine biosynthesis protein TsaB